MTDRFRQAWDRDWNRPRDWDEAWARYRERWLAHPTLNRLVYPLYGAFCLLAVSAAVASDSLLGRLWWSGLAFIWVQSIRHHRSTLHAVRTQERPPEWFKAPLWQRILTGR